MIFFESEPAVAFGYGEASGRFEKDSRKTKGSGAADKAAVQQVSEGGSPRKSCRVNCPVRTRSDAGARDR